MEHAGVKQTSGAASLAAGARIGSGLIGQLAPASTSSINVKQSLLAFYILHTGKTFLLLVCGTSIQTPAILLEWNVATENGNA